MRLTSMLTAMAGACAATIAMAANPEELALGDDTFLTVRDAAFAVVRYNDEGFGLTIAPEVTVRGGGAEQTRPVTKEDLARACTVVLGLPEARVGEHPPDFVFFQVLRRDSGGTFLRLRRTESVYFETRTDRCRAFDGVPRDVK